MATSRFSVTTPVSERSLLTLAEVRLAAGVSDASRDDELMRMARSASTAIARQCCIADDGVNPPTLLAETCTEIFRWSGCGRLRLSRRPVTSIGSITVDGATIAAEGYEVSGQRQVDRLSDDTLTSWAAGKITVVYVAGFATAPEDLKLACMKLVTAVAAETGRDPSLKREDIPGVMEREYWVAAMSDPFLSKEIGDLVSPYAEMWI